MQINWTFFQPESLPEDFAATWDRLNRRHCGSNPGLDYRFVWPLLRVFGDGSELVAVCDSGDETIAAVILESDGPARWQIYSPSQACLCPMVFNRNHDASILMDELLRQLPGFATRLRISRIDPACQPYTQLADAPTSDTSSYGTTFNITLEQPFDDYWQGRWKGLRYKLRKLGRLAEKDNKQFALMTSVEPEEVTAGVNTHGCLESKGWKGQNGTAISEHNAQGEFYREIMSGFARTGDALIAQLRCDNEVIASLLCIGLNDTMIVLKTAYDESYAKYAPGRLMDYYFLEKICGISGYRNVEMYTRASSSDLSWATDSREWYDLDIYRNRVVHAGFEAVRRIRDAAARTTK